MAVAVQARRLASPALRTLARRRLAELGAVLLAAAAVALLVAVASYHAADPSLDTATARPVANVGGLPGAIAADLLLQGFGAAGLLPGLALLAWAWRIGSHRGLHAFPLRLAALLAALPVAGAVLAAVPGRDGQLLTWPAGAGLGGAIGRLVGEEALAAGHDLLGPFGPPLVLTLGAVLAVLLAVLALGLSRNEWRAAGLAAPHGRSRPSRRRTVRAAVGARGIDRRGVARSA